MKKKRTSIRVLTTVATLATIALTASGCAGGGGSGQADADGVTHITIATQAQPTGFSLWLAQDLGYYKEAGLDVDFQIAESGAALLASGAAGDWQVGYMGGPPLISGYKTWGLLPAGAMMDEYRNLILFMDKDVLAGTDPATALATTPVGVVANSTSAQLLYACADALGVAAADIETVPLGPAAIANGRLNDDINAAVLFSVNNAPLLADPDKYVQVCDGEKAGVSILDPYVVTPRFWAENPDAAAAWVDAVYKANEWIIDTPRDEVLATFQVFLKEMGIEATDEEATYALDARQWLTFDQALEQMRGTAFTDSLTKTAEFLVGAGVYDEMPAIPELNAKGLEIMEAAAQRR